MIRHTIIVVISLIIALIFLPSGESHSTSPESTSPSDDESSIRPAPEPQIIATSTSSSTEPEPIPETTEEELPPGVYCLEDCPLIDPATVKGEVEEFFADHPIMVEVARCESTFYHYDPETGKALQNREGSSAIGVFQIMRSYHEKPARERGWDIRDFYGNMEYAYHLYMEQGLRPWEASRKCWGSAYTAINKGFSDA